MKEVMIKAHAGSPPLMRGKDRFNHTVVFNRRITPAHAGKSVPENYKNRPYEDHPRSCGEKSPRMKMNHVP